MGIRPYDDSMADEVRTEREQIRAAKRKELERKLAEEGKSRTETESPSEPIVIRDNTHFESVREQYRVTLVDCYADWCGPCKMLEPTINGLAADTAAAIAKLDVDAHPDIAQELGVRGVPTLVLFVEGEMTDRLVGVQDRETLERLLQNHL